MKTRQMLLTLAMLLMTLSVHAVTTVINYELNDSYGDGWNGASISVVDAETGQEWASLTIDSGESSVGSFMLVSGRTYHFIWKSGSYDDECSFTFTDVKGNVFLKHSVGSSFGDGTLLTYVAFMKGDVNSDGKISIADVMDEVKYVVNDGGAEQPEPDENVEIRYELRDSYGDGWNGASLHVFDTGIWDYVEVLTIDEGYSNSGTITLTAGHTYYFEWFSGSYDDECSFSIYDSAGEELFSWSASDIPMEPIEEEPLQGTVLERETIASVKLQKVVPSVKVAKEKKSKPSRIRKEPVHGDLLFEYTPEGGTSTTVSSSRDLNDDGNINISDVMVLVNYVSNGIPIPDLELSSESLEVFTYNNATIEIVSGSGFFEAISSNPDNLGVTLSGMTITITSKRAGSYVVTVKDVESNETKEIQVVVKEPQLSCPDNNHPHMIDLGLPSGTKWACCNVDATSPEGFGGYYAWGETNVKEEYNWSSYIHCDGTEQTCHDIGGSICGTQYDVAHVKWGDMWRMPSESHKYELINKCQFQWTSINDVQGMVFTGPNGNAIFLPAGNAIGDSDLAKCEGRYWTGTGSSERTAIELLFNEDYCVYWDSGRYRFVGKLVRPVYTETVPLALNKSSITVEGGSNATVEIISGSGNYTVESSNANVATAVIDDGMVSITAVKGGTAAITITDTQTSEKLSVIVSVPYAQITFVCPDDNHPHMIDLGLPSGTKWACCNVGAGNPEDYGDYYAWGETETKYENGFYRENYAHYCEDGCYGGANENVTFTGVNKKGAAKVEKVKDGRKREEVIPVEEGDRYKWRDLGDCISGTEYDAAYVNWGDTWRMPSNNQFNEMLNNCIYEPVVLNGKAGLKCTGPNGNSIFLPFTGYALYGFGTDYEEEGRYWTGDNYYPAPWELDWNDEQTSWGDFSSNFNILPDGGSLDNYTIPRWFGATIRPISIGEPQVNLCPDDNHPHVIDLGLPSGTKWACCNVDPTPSRQSPTNFGGYYSWGELEVKNSYGLDDYEYFEGGEMAPIFTFLGEDISGTQYDVAHVKWGGSWQMPSNTQIQELISNCSYSWISFNGVNGALFTGSNNAKIFLPAAGIINHYGLDEEYGLIGEGKFGNYWSSIDIYNFANPGEFSTVDTFRATLDFSVDGAEESAMAPFEGCSVRPVRPAATTPHLILSTTTIDPIKEGETITIDILSGSGNYQVEFSDHDVLGGGLEEEENTIYITGLLWGRAVVTVTDLTTGETISFSVEVYQGPPPFSLSEESLTLYVGGTAKVYPYDGNDDYTCESSDESVATVEYIEYEEEDPDGGPSLYECYFLITSVGPGTASITVTDEWSGETATVEVTVTNKHEINRSVRPVSSNNH